MSENSIKNTIEAILLVANEPMSLTKCFNLLDKHERPERDELKKIMEELQADYEGRAMELLEVASGFRIQVRQAYATTIAKMWEEKPPRYSRALLETLALIVYKQPITRGEIEEVRGVAVSTNIIRTLVERGWVKEVGHKQVPGHPALYATSKQFLDDFNMKSLRELPEIPEPTDLAALDDALQVQLGLPVDTTPELEATGLETTES